VPEVLEELNILGLRVDRWSGIHGPAANLEDLPRLTVCTTSTHDSSTLRGWWEEDGRNRAEYCRSLDLHQHPDYLTTEACAAILARNLDANSMIVVLPLQDLFALHYDLRTLEPGAERINLPGVQSPINWTYRIKLTIEDLLAYDAFNDFVSEVITVRRNKPLAALSHAAATADAS
jgi:4-alpha-glucanotransferase